MPGIYTEPCDLNQNYVTSEFNVTIKSYYAQPESMAVWRSVATGSYGMNYCLNMSHTDYTTVEGIKFMPDGEATHLIWARVGTQCIIRNCYFLGLDGASTANYGVASTSTGGSPDNFAIENCIFYRIKDYAIWFSCSYAQGVAKNNRIINNTFYRCGKGVYLRGPNDGNKYDGASTVIANNIFDSLGTTFYLSHDEPFKVYNSVINDYDQMLGTANANILFRDTLINRSPGFIIIDETQWTVNNFLKPSLDTVITGAFDTTFTPEHDFYGSFRSTDSITIGAVLGIADTIPPLVYVYSSQVLVESLSVVNTDVYFTISATDNITIENDIDLEITLNDVPYDTSTAVTDEDTYVLMVIATDMAGNKDTVWVNFIIDKTAPVITISSADLDEDNIVNNDVSFSVSITDNYTDQSKIFSANRLNGELIDIGNPIVGEGTHVFMVTAWDEAGNSDSSVVNFVIDRTPPSTYATPGPFTGDLSYGVDITLSDGPDVRIYFTVDGSVPDENSIRFSPDSLIHITDNAIIKFFGIDTAGNVELIKNTAEYMHSTGTVCYYVSQSGGNDAWSGISPDSAWNTLAYALSRLPSGTAENPYEINIMDGVFDAAYGSFYLNRDSINGAIAAHDTMMRDPEFEGIDELSNGSFMKPSTTSPALDSS
ncbi:MAG: chitobiase/beta-hexosaminidase C-terminal domain-containing protein [bacterium]